MPIEPRHEVAEHAPRIGQHQVNVGALHDHEVDQHAKGVSGAEEAIQEHLLDDGVGLEQVSAVACRAGHQEGAARHAHPGERHGLLSAGANHGLREAER
jgi:hypothetical protein